MRPSSASHPDGDGGEPTLAALHAAILENLAGRLDRIQERVDTLEARLPSGQARR
jgi:hypothetical protein